MRFFRTLLPLRRAAEGNMVTKPGWSGAGGKAIFAGQGIRGRRSQCTHVSHGKAEGVARQPVRQHGRDFVQEWEWDGLHAPGRCVLFGGVALVKNGKANINVTKAVQAGINEVQLLCEARGHFADGFLYCYLFRVDRLVMGGEAVYRHGSAG